MDKTFISDKAEKNITLLALYLKNVAKLEADDAANQDVKFKMQEFYEIHEKVDGMVCKSSACAIGHFAVMIGAHIGQYEVDLPCGAELSWIEFSRDVIGIARDGFDAESNAVSIIWEWLFSDMWSAIDNTPLGAAARIEYFLENGVPNEFLKSRHEIGSYAPSLVDLYMPIRERLQSEVDAMTEVTDIVATYEYI